MNRTWHLVIVFLLPWIVAAIIVSAPYLVPDSHYIAFKTFHVDDSTDDVSPAITYVRKVRRPFTASWTAQIRKLIGDKSGHEIFYNYCNAYGIGSYTPKTVPPIPTTITWLLSQPCPLGEGRYYISITWALYLPFGSRDIQAESNVFTIAKRR